VPGGREISGADVRAAAAAGGADPAALDAAVRPGDAFASYEDLLAACPPERIGLTPGAHAAVLSPLFGEFE
jgi:hypothetical protein